jgi:hypothetical protein
MPALVHAASKAVIPSHRNFVGASLLRTPDRMGEACVMRLGGDDDTDDVITIIIIIKQTIDIIRAPQPCALARVLAACVGVPAMAEPPGILARPPMFDGRAIWKIPET